MKDVISAHSRQVIISRIDALLELASNALDRSFQCNSVKLNLKGKAAGQFIVRRVNGKLLTEIRLNEWMLNRYGKTFLDEVLPHECAHLVVFGLYSGSKRVRPHGSEWKYVMREVFKVEPKTRHSFETESRVYQRFIYQCACDDRLHELTSIRHNRIVKGVATYKCRACDVTLSFKEKGATNY